MAAGAFGAHALKARLAPDSLALWQTAAQYHVWHALGLALVGLCAIVGAEAVWLRWSGWLMLAGVLLFSGSLYALALGAPRPLGVLTPVGGAALILSWLALAGALLRA
ncbi:MAG: DUF423 domain-containing protein [Burkholderiales bacterium]